MAANDELRQFDFSLATISAAPSILLPASPGVQWVLDDADLFVWSSGAAATFYDGNLFVYDGPTNASPVIGQTLWQFWVSAANTGYSDEVSLGPIRGTPGHAMLIVSSLANGVLANTQQRLKVLGHVV